MTKPMATADSIRLINEETDKVADFKASLRPLVLRHAPPVQPSKPELTGTALAFDRMQRLARLMGNRSPAAYYRAANEQLEILISEIRELAAHEEDVTYEIGERLHVLKRRKPEGLAWNAYLVDLKFPFGKRRADEYISVFLGMTTALKLKEKKRASMHKARSKRAQRGAQRSLDSKQKLPDRPATNGQGRDLCAEVGGFINELLDFYPDFDNRLREWHAGLPGPLDKDAQEALVERLHSASNGLTLLAQLLDAR
jgi:hypothetical protein